MCKIHCLRKVVFFYLFSFVFSHLAFAQVVPVPAEESEKQQKPTVIAFVNVNVVPMDSERILPGHTVVVKAGRISEIGPVDEIDIPNGALQIDGSDKYLMPGLVDMHVHQPHTANFQLILFIANGVTTIRNMWGQEYNLKLREQIEKGQIISPTIYTTGPIIDAVQLISGAGEIRAVVKTPEQAAQAVTEHKEAGYDFIKVYDNLSLECYDAIIETAAKQGIPVVGHVPNDVGLEHALAARQYSLEHLSGYGSFLKVEDCQPWDQIDETKLQHITRTTRKAGTWNCVTLVLFQKQRGMRDQEAEQERKLPYMKYITPFVREGWIKTRWFEASHNIRMFNRKRVTKALHDTGARILLGSDCPNAYVVAGFSLHQELQNLVDAGLTPYEAIKAGTHDAAECLGELNEFGTITAGLRADLILTEDNPLEEVDNVARRVGVMVRGRWFPQSKLQTMLDALAIKHATEENPDGVMLNGRWFKREELELLVAPVLYLPFDDADKLEDLSPAKSPIESYVKPAKLVAGIRGNAWLFDQSTCVLLDTETLKEPFTQNTFSVWVREPGEDGILYEEGGRFSGYAVSLIKGELEFATRFRTLSTFVRADFPDDDNWHFVTTVFDSETMKLYIDGNLVEEASTNHRRIFDYGDAISIGKVDINSSGGTEAKFTGIMDELRITRRALTSAEIQAMYREGI